MTILEYIVLIIFVAGLIYGFTRAYDEIRDKKVSEVVDEMGGAIFDMLLLLFAFAVIGGIFYLIWTFGIPAIISSK